MSEICENCDEHREDCRCEQDCETCGESMRLEHGKVWPTGPLYCWECAHARLEKYRYALAAIADASACSHTRDMAKLVLGKKRAGR